MRPWPLDSRFRRTASARWSESIDPVGTTWATIPCTGSTPKPREPEAMTIATPRTRARRARVNSGSEARIKTQGRLVLPFPQHMKLSRYFLKIEGRYVRLVAPRPRSRQAAANRTRNRLSRAISEWSARCRGGRRFVAPGPTDSIGKTAPAAFASRGARAWRMDLKDGLSFDCR